MFRDLTHNNIIGQVTATYRYKCKKQCRTCSCDLSFQYTLVIVMLLDWHINELQSTVQIYLVYDGRITFRSTFRITHKLSKWFYLLIRTSLTCVTKWTITAPNCIPRFWPVRNLKELIIFFIIRGSDSIGSAKPRTTKTPGILWIYSFDSTLVKLDIVPRL